MNDPGSGKPSDKNPEANKQPLEKRETQPPALSLTNEDNVDVTRKIVQQRKDNDPAVEKNLTKVDITFNVGMPLGAQPLAKSEFKVEIDKPVEPYRPLIQDFLNKTSLDDQVASRDFLKQVSETRESLSNAANAQDAVSDALHLARLYQHMQYIDEAKKALDLSLGIDPENDHGTKLFKELERMHPADIGVSNPIRLSQPLSKSNLRKRISSLSGGKIIVLGDLLIDELLEGKPERISREAPVLILEHVDTELIPGGAANTANNIAALGGRCHAIGVCGKDEYAGKLAALFDKAGITHSLVSDASRPTTVKTRILSKSHSFKQQLLRLDRISHERIDANIESQLVSKLHESVGDYKAIILSDYRAGVMTDDLIRAVRAVAAEKNLLLVVDAQDDFARFQNVTLMTPNQPDTEKMVGFEITDQESLQRAGNELLMMTGAAAVLVTRGAEGMVLFQQNEPMIALPAFNRSDVFDVSGAGDTVVATMTLALVTGSSFFEAMALGNLAAGIVVKKPGTAVLTQNEMLENLELLKIQES